MMGGFILTGLSFAWISQSSSRREVSVFWILQVKTIWLGRIINYYPDPDAEIQYWDKNIKTDQGFSKKKISIFICQGTDNKGKRIDYDYYIQYRKDSKGYPEFIFILSICIEPGPITKKYCQQYCGELAFRSCWWSYIVFRNFTCFTRLPYMRVAIWAWRHPSFYWYSTFRAEDLIPFFPQVLIHVPPCN